MSISSCRTGFPLFGNYLSGINSDDPAVRVRSIAKAAKLRDARAIPLLIDRLDDEDGAVRIAANEALKQITGKDFGYRDFDPLYKRKQAVERWRNWLKSRNSNRNKKK